VIVPLRPVPIAELSGLGDDRHWELDHNLEALETLTPVRGHIHAQHRGNLLEVEGLASTIVTLRCDRCLQHFNHPLAFATRELLWLGEGDREAALLEADLDTESEALLDLDPDALGETLDPAGSFDPAHWAFEHLSLQLPLVNRCGADCPGPASWGSQDDGPIDPRWAALAALNPPSGPPQAS
jgi:uncharacterized protein